MKCPTGCRPFSRSKNREKNIENKFVLHNNQAKKELQAYKQGVGSLFGAQKKPKIGRICIFTWG